MPTVLHGKGTSDISFLMPLPRLMICKLPRLPRLKIGLQHIPRPVALRSRHMPSANALSQILLYLLTPLTAWCIPLCGRRGGHQHRSLYCAWVRHPACWHHGISYKPQGSLSESTLVLHCRLPTGGASCRHPPRPAAAPTSRLNSTPTHSPTSQLCRLTWSTLSSRAT